MTSVEPSPVATRSDSLQRLLRMVSGLVVTFFAFGFASWLCGAVCWLAFYAGARGANLSIVARIATVVGFIAGAVAPLVGYRRRCLRGKGDIPPLAALAACASLPVGGIFWAVFVDAIAWHHGRDVVRPAFDFAIMYVLLISVLPLAIGMPWVMKRSRTRGAVKA